MTLPASSLYFSSDVFFSKKSRSLSFKSAFCFCSRSSSSHFLLYKPRIPVAMWSNSFKSRKPPTTITATSTIAPHISWKICTSLSFVAASCSKTHFIIAAESGKHCNNIVIIIFYSFGFCLQIYKIFLKTTNKLTLFSICYSFILAIFSNSSILSPNSFN